MASPLPMKYMQKSGASTLMIQLAVPSVGFHSDFSNKLKFFINFYIIIFTNSFISRFRGIFGLFPVDHLAGNRSKRSRLQEFQNCSSIIPLRQISLINPESPSVMAGRRGCRTQVRSDGDRSVDGIRTYSTRGTSSSRATSISPVSGHHDAKAGRGRCGRGVSKLSPLQKT